MPVTVPSFDALWEAFKAEAQSRDADLTDWLPGSVLDALAGASSVLADEQIRAVIDAFAAHFVDTAEGADLLALALDRFNLPASTFAAQAATLPLRFSRSGGSNYITIPAATSCKGTVDGEEVEFTTDSVVGIPGASSRVDNVPATCTVAGKAGNIAAGVLDTVNDGAGVPDDSGVVVSHLERAVGGREAFSDDEIRAYLRSYFNTLRKGTVDAVEFGAKTVGGVYFATADESNVAPADGGYTTVYVGDVTGRSNSTLEAAVLAELLNWRACGVSHLVDGMEREEVTLDVTVYVPSTLTHREELRDAIREAILGYTDQLVTSEKLYSSQVEHAALGSSDRLVDVLVEGSGGPFTSISPAAPQNALRVTADDLKITFADA
jgi:hypothetical protein